MAGKYTFWTLISDKKIVIPIIQRDYAQGRVSKERIRKNFLEQLGKSIGVVDCKEEERKAELDFVYGSEKEGTMHPLDGQQRLTTLWLLHWYVAYKAGKLGKKKETLKKFSYETRTSSREFCEKLCELEYKETDKIVEHITNQTWFFTAWKQDPTIQAMLRMLSGTDNSDSNEGEFVDGIEELFKDKSDFATCWDSLTSEDCKITFNFLPLNSNELPISDDLYIKMNARGKALTSFENFKADLIKWIQDNYAEKEFVDFTSKIDNAWTDIFWTKGKVLGRVDELFFAFINRYFYNLAITNNEDNLNDDNSSQNIYYAYFSDSKNKLNNDKKIAYTSFDYYSHFLNKEVFNDFSTIMDNYISSSSKFPNLQQMLECKWNNEFRFIPEFCKGEDEKYKEIIDNASNKIHEVTTLNQMERVVFYAICKYFKEGEITDDGTSLKQWMRFVWNLVSDYDNQGWAIRSISAMKPAITLIDKILNSHDVYNELSKLSDESSNSEIDKRFNEEIAKAKQIIKKQGNPSAIGPDEDQIIKAENYAFFKGAIRFLFTDENETKEKWENFDTKWENAKKYFSEDGSGVSEPYTTKAILLRSLIAYIDNFPTNDYNSWKNNFRIYFNKKDAPIWRNILLNQNKLSSKLLLRCKEENELNSYNSPQGDAYLKDVQEELVKTLLLDKIEKNYRLRWRDDFLNGCLALHPDNAKSANNYYIFHQRNTILTTTANLESSHKIDGLNFFRGKDIIFTYNGYTFIWQHWNWIDMYESNQRLQDIPKFKDHCVIDGAKVTDSDSLINELNRCIKKYEEIKNQGNPPTVP